MKTNMYVRHICSSLTFLWFLLSTNKLWVLIFYFLARASSTTTATNIYIRPHECFQKVLLCANYYLQNGDTFAIANKEKAKTKQTHANTHTHKLRIKIICEGRQRAHFSTEWMKCVRETREMSQIINNNSFHSIFGCWCKRKRNKVIRNQKC